MIGEENEREVEKGEVETKERMERSSAETLLQKKRPKTQTIEMNGRIPIGTTAILIQFK